MRKFAILLVVAVAVCAMASVAQATDWTTYLTSTTTTGTIKVVSSASLVGSLWHYSYEVTPITPADEVRGYTIALGDYIMAQVTNVATTATGWTGNTDSTKVYWTWTSGNATDRLNTGETFTFSFDHPWEPVAFYIASCQDDHGFSGRVAGPVPEATTLLLGFAGLGCIGGLRRLRTKK